MAKRGSMVVHIVSAVADRQELVERLHMEGSVRQHSTLQHRAFNRHMRVDRNTEPAPPLRRQCLMQVMALPPDCSHSSMLKKNRLQAHLGRSARAGREAQHCCTAVHCTQRQWCATVQADQLLRRHGMQRRRQPHHSVSCRRVL